MAGLKTFNSQALTVVLCGLFAILYGVWILPHTVFIRNACLILGALLSVPVIYVNRLRLWQKQAIPLALMLVLLLWVSVHLMWVGSEPITQLMEYTKIWKKIAISVVFATGLGLSIGMQTQDPVLTKRAWKMIYFGLTLPMIIYSAKWFMNALAVKMGWTLSPYLILSKAIFTDGFAINRPGYVFFFLPATAIAIAAIARALQHGSAQMKTCWPYYAVALFFPIFCLYENDRLGLVLDLALMGVAVIPLLKKYFQRNLKVALTLLMITLGVFFVLLGVSVKENAQWKTLWVDAKIAVQVDQYDAWKYARESYPLPKNEMGVTVSTSNYERIAWATVGSRLALHNPLGYGLMSQSFGRLCRQNWPDAQTSWSHSAWLDFTLGYGFPGVALLGLAALLAWRQSKALISPWNVLGRWALGALIAVLFVKEVAAEVYFNTFIFLLVLVSAIACTSANAALKPKDR